MTAVWAGLIFYLSTRTYGASFTAWLLEQILEFFHVSLSPAAFATLHHLIRKTAHVTEYAIFGIFLYHSLEGSTTPRWSWRTAVWAVGIAAIYSLTDEFHQEFVPGRGPSLVDCSIDSSGAAVGVLILYIRGRFRSSHTQGDTVETADIAH